MLLLPGRVFYEMMRDYVVPSAVEGIVGRERMNASCSPRTPRYPSSSPTPTSPLAAYAEDLAGRLTVDRESLAAWLRARIALGQAGRLTTDDPTERTRVPGIAGYLGVEWPRTR
jgi:hypothetical protein